MSDKTANIPTLDELEADFQQMEGIRFPKVNAVLTKAFGLFLIYAMRKQVHWDSERAGYLQMSDGETQCARCGEVFDNSTSRIKHVHRKRCPEIKTEDECDAAIVVTLCDLAEEEVNE